MTETNKIQPLIVVNTMQYEAVQLNSPEAVELVTEWITPFLDAGDELDFTPMLEAGAYALRQPTGEVAFVHPGHFLQNFEEIETTDPQDPDGFVASFQKMIDAQDSPETPNA